MEEQKNSKASVQIIWRHSSLLLKILVIVLIVFSMAAMAALGWVQVSIRNQTEQMKAEAAALEERIKELEDRIQNIDSVQTIRDIAKEELGMVTSDTILIQPE